MFIVNESLVDFFEHGYALDCKLRQVYQQYGVEDILQTVCGLCSTTDASRFATASLILRDFYIGSDLSDEQKSDYLASVEARGVLQCVAKLLYANNFSLRSHAIYTLGKMSQPYIAGHLVTAFEDFYFDHDPCAARDALWELSWLGYDIAPLCDSLLEHANEIFPWLCFGEFSLEQLQALKGRAFRLSVVRKDLDYAIESAVKMAGEPPDYSMDDLPQSDTLEIILNQVAHRNNFFEYTAESFTQFVEYYYGNQLQQEQDLRACNADQARLDVHFKKLFEQTFARYPAMSDVR